MPRTYTLEEIAALGWLSPEEAKLLRDGIAFLEGKLAEFEQRLVGLRADRAKTDAEMQSLRRDQEILKARLDLLEGGEYKH